MSDSSSSPPTESSADASWREGWRPPDLGALFVVNGPSGVGKTTLIRRLVTDVPYLSHAPSVTTRPPRDGEKDGVEYVFTTREDFEGRIRRNEMLEWVVLAGEYYGTPKETVSTALRRGRSVVMVVNYAGLEQLRQHKLDAVTIFVMPPSKEELARRLTDRGTDTPDAIRERIESGMIEMAHRHRYAYFVVNEYLETAYMELRSIVIATLCRGDNRWRLRAKAEP